MTQSHVAAKQHVADVNIALSLAYGTGTNPVGKRLISMRQTNMPDVQPRVGFQAA